MMVWGIAKHFAAWIAYSAFGASPNNSAITNLALHTRSLASMLAASSFPGRTVRPNQPRESSAYVERKIRSQSSQSVVCTQFRCGGWIKENLQGRENHNETRR
jgi:hypothetical protein